MSRYPIKLAIFLLLGSVAWGAVTCGSAVTIANNSNSSALNTTAGNIILAGTAGFGMAVYLSDNISNNYNWASGYGATGAPTVTIGYAMTIGSQTLQTNASTVFNFTNGQSTANINGNADPGGIAQICSGVLGYQPSVVNGSASASGASTFTESATAVNPGDLVFTCAATNSSSFTAAINESFSTPTVQVPTAGEGITCSWLVVGAGTTSVNPQWTMSANTDWRWTTVVFPGCGLPCGEAVPSTAGPTTQVIVGKTGSGPGVTAGYPVYADGCGGTSVLLLWPTQMVFAKTGLLVWADLNYNEIRGYNPTSASITEYGQTIGSGCVQALAGNKAIVNGGSYNYSTPVSGLTAIFAHPVGMAIDQNDNVYIADQQNNTIAALNASSGVVSLAAGSGPGTNGSCNNGSFSGDGGAATSAGLNCPQGVAVIPNVGSGFLLALADGANRAVRLVNYTGASYTGFGVTIAPGNIQTIAGHNGAGCSTSGSGLSAQIKSTNMGLTAYNGSFYWADSVCNRVIQLNSSGTISLIAGNGSQGYAYGNATSACEFQQAFDVRFDSNGVAYVTDQLGSQVVMVKNGVCSLIVGVPSLYGTLGGFSPGGMPARFTALGGAFNAGQAGPIATQVDGLGNLWIADTGNNRILKMVLPCYGTCVQ